MGPLYADCVPDAKARFLKNSSHSFVCAEVICPRPQRAVRVPYFMDHLSSFSPEPKRILLKNGDRAGLEIIGILLNKAADVLQEEMDEMSGGGEKGCICWSSSPPARTDNPVTRDALFAKQMSTSSTSSSAANKANSNTSPRAEKGIVSGSPKVRVEGFSCGNSDPRCVVSTLA